MRGKTCSTCIVAAVFPVILLRAGALRGCLPPSNQMHGRQYCSPSSFGVSYQIREAVTFWRKLVPHSWRGRTRQVGGRAAIDGVMTGREGATKSIVSYWVTSWDVILIRSGNCFYSRVSSAYRKGLLCSSDALIRVTEMLLLLSICRICISLPSFFLLAASSTPSAAHSLSDNWMRHLLSTIL
jgi:hypothetical protein